MKYTNVKVDAKRIVRLFKAGKNVSQIAQAIGYPKGRGRCRRLLTVQPGLAARGTCLGIASPLPVIR